MFLQFGTSRFLQAHADLILSEAMPGGQVCVVQSSGSAETAGRVAALAQEGGFPVRIQGLRDGHTVDEETRVTSVRRALSSATHWPDVVREALDCRFLLSNVSEAGYRTQPADRAAGFDNAMSFVAKLCLLLKARFEAGCDPITIMPLELFPSNGAHLRDGVTRLATARGESAGFIDSLSRHIWVNSLVDRIVSEPLHPVGAVAEPYCLWAIETTDGLDLPFTHPAVTVVADLKPYERLKLYLLNLSHTYMAHVWLSRHLPANLTVSAFLADETLAAPYRTMIAREVLPTFANAGMARAAEAYVQTTLERFGNPFLNHRLADIASGHAAKVASRLASFLDWARDTGDASPKPVLAAIVDAT